MYITYSISTKQLKKEITMLPMTVKVPVAIGGVIVLTWAGRKLLIENGLRLDEDYQRFLAIEKQKIQDAKKNDASDAEIKTLRKKISKKISKERKRTIKFISSSKNMNKILKKLSKEDKQSLLLQHGNQYGFNMELRKKAKRKKAKK